MARPTTRKIAPTAVSLDTLTSSVFSGIRTIQLPAITLPAGLKVNTRLKMDGLELLAKLPTASIPVAFFDPQYRGVLDKLSFGNEGKSGHNGGAHWNK